MPGIAQFLFEDQDSVPAAALKNTKLALNAYLEARLDNAFEMAFVGEPESMHSQDHRDAVAAARAKSAGARGES